MIGSEKQIAWAEQIKAKTMKEITRILNSLERPAHRTMSQNSEMKLATYAEILPLVDDAWWWINRNYNRGIPARFAPSGLDWQQASPPLFMYQHLASNGPFGRSGDKYYGKRAADYYAAKLPNGLFALGWSYEPQPRNDPRGIVDFILCERVS